MTKEISFYLGHDANVTVYDTKTKHVKLYSLEKYFDFKHVNIGSSRFKKISNVLATNDRDLYFYLRNFFEENGFLDETFSAIYVKRFMNYAFANEMTQFLKAYAAINYIFCLLKSNKKFLYMEKSPADHHKLHARVSYGESNFKNALAFTYDAGGDWENSSVVGFKNNATTYIKYLDNQMTGVYQNCGRQIKEIDSKTQTIDISGKVMGLSAYGKPTKESVALLKKFRNFEFIGKYNRENEHDLSRLNNELEAKCYKMFNITSQVSIPKSADFAWALQKLFEQGNYYHFKKEVLPLCSEYDNNVVLGGGGALNVLFNSMLTSLHPEINFYVPPDPSDGCLSLGLMMHHHREIRQYGKYGKEELYDAEKLDDYVRLHSATPCSLKEFVNLINAGSIVGYLYGNIEIGPRALCHRSILCNAKFPSMKKILNEKVKNREWYRPFAPVCREEDAEKYFEYPHTDPAAFSTMAYSVTVKEEYRDKLKSITHEDNTARLQTLRKEDAPFVYYALDKIDGNVLLNTSFNKAGKPILNRISTALEVLNNTDMDCVLIYDEKRNVHWKFS